jgi:hypothetical protein
MPRTLRILLPLLLSLAIGGCLWLSVGSLGYEGYQYSEKQGGLYTALHPTKSPPHATTAPTQDTDIE